MSESLTAKRKPLKIGFQGAYFKTGNLGVSALAESSIKIIFNRWPDVKVTLFSGGSKTGEHRVSLNDRELYIKMVPIRFCKNVLLSNHFIVLFCYAIVFKVFRWNCFKRVCCHYNPYLKEIIETDIVMDISAGDSFSDIYGMRTLVFGFLSKWLMLLFDKPLILLPQTYGPFKKPLAKVMARFIFKRASMIYTRDKEGVNYIRDLMKSHNVDDKVRFCPDVAFVLDARRPEKMDIGTLEDVRTKDTIVVGLNISGLLFNCDYTQNNMFGLKSDYRELITAVIESLMKDIRVKILLIPHVCSPADYEGESDSIACLAIYELMIQKYPGRLFLTRGIYNQNNIKYIIGMCDFFIGSRMHSCIAALSQCIPAVGIAYSKKFQGVFESVKQGHGVVDARSCDEKQVIEKIELALERKDEIHEHLRDIMPKVRANILNIFKD